MENNVSWFAIGFLPIHLYATYMNIMIISGQITDRYSVNTAIFLLICISMGIISSLYNIYKLVSGFIKKKREENTHGMVEE